MFTGIIQKTTKIMSVTDERGALRARLSKPHDWQLTKGQSISIDGICSTVVAYDEDSFDVQYIPETLSKTTAGAFAAGSVVNLERSLRLTDFVDGHLVQGHVDAAVEIDSVVHEGSTYELSISIPERLHMFVAALGSIAINGVSLTVARRESGIATVALIPETLESTNLGRIQKGDHVNVEVDIVARYLAAQGNK